MVQGSISTSYFVQIITFISRTRFNQRHTFFKWEEKGSQKRIVSVLKQNKQHILLLSKKVVNFKPKTTFNKKRKAKNQLWFK